MIVSNRWSACLAPVALQLTRGRSFFGCSQPVGSPPPQFLHDNAIIGIPTRTLEIVRFFYSGNMTNVKLF
jgi:hypothetical protein